MKLVSYKSKGRSERGGWSSEAVVAAIPGRHDDQLLEQYWPIRNSSSSVELLLSSYDMGVCIDCEEHSVQSRL